MTRALVLALALAACGGDDSPPTNDAGTTPWDGDLDTTDGDVQVDAPPGVRSYTCTENQTCGVIGNGGYMVVTSPTHIVTDDPHAEEQHLITLCNQNGVTTCGGPNRITCEATCTLDP